MKIAIKNIHIVDPVLGTDKKASVLVHNGIIEKIGTLQGDDLKNAALIEGEGKTLTPGLFDMHVHLREPGREDEETVVSGCNAAMAGGFTGVACMPNTDPVIDSAEVVALILQKAAGHAVSVHPIAAATAGRKGEYISPMLELVEAGAVGFSDDGNAIKTARVLRSAMEYAKMSNVPIIEHCEDESLEGGAMHEGYYSTLYGLPASPAIAEELTVVRDIMMAQLTGAQVHIAHISSAKSIQLVREGKQKGVRVTSEVTPHHFTLTDELLGTYDTNLKMNPPLRSNEDLAAILEGLRDGTIDCIATDHAPHSIEEKELEFEYAPNGIIGLETAFGLAYTELVKKGVLSFTELLMKMAVNPRKILNLDIPTISVGAKANFTILDLQKVWTVQVSEFLSKSRNSPFGGRLLTGKAEGVMNQGRFWHAGKWVC